MSKRQLHELLMQQLKIQFKSCNFPWFLMSTFAVLDISLCVCCLMCQLRRFTTQPGRGYVSLLDGEGREVRLYGRGKWDLGSSMSVILILAVKPVLKTKIYVKCLLVTNHAWMLTSVVHHQSSPTPRPSPVTLCMVPFPVSPIISSSCLTQ